MDGSESGVQRGLSANGKRRGWCAYFGRRLGSDRWSLFEARRLAAGRGTAAHITRCPRRLTRWQKENLGWQRAILALPLARWSRFLCMQTTGSSVNEMAGRNNSGVDQWTSRPHKQPVFEASVGHQSLTNITVNEPLLSRICVAIHHASELGGCSKPCLSYPLTSHFLVLCQDSGGGQDPSAGLTTHIWRPCNHHASPTTLPCFLAGRAKVDGRWVVGGARGGSSTVPPSFAKDLPDWQRRPSAVECNPAGLDLHLGGFAVQQSSSSKWAWMPSRWGLEWRHMAGRLTPCRHQASTALWKMTTVLTLCPCSTASPPNALFARIPSGLAQPYDENRRRR